MKYVRKQSVITTVVDEEITEESKVKALVENLNKTSVDFSILFKDEKIDHIRSFSKCRIKAVYDDCFDITVFRKKASMVFRNISYSDLIKIELVTSKYNILIPENNITSYDFLDFGE